MKKVIPIFVASSSFFFSYYSRLSWSILSIYMPFHPTVTQEGIAFALFFVGYALVQIPAGFLADRYSGGKIITYSLLGLALATFLSGIAKGIFQEYETSIFMGLTAGWIYPASINIMKTHYGDNLSKSIGYYSIAWPLAIILSGVTLPFIAIKIGWEWGYYLSSIGSIIIAVISFRIPTNRSKRVMNFNLLRNRNLLLLAIGGFFFFLSYWSITLYAYKYFLFIGINPSLSGLIFSSMALGGIPATLLSGYVSNKTGVKKMILFSLIIYGISVATFSIVLSAILLLLISLIMGFFRFLITPGNSNMAAIIGKEDAASASGISNLFWQSSGIAGPILSAFLITELGYRYMWISMFLIILIGTVFYLFINGEN
jgi:MFS family permease